MKVIKWIGIAFAGLIVLGIIGAAVGGGEDDSSTSGGDLTSSSGQQAADVAPKPTKINSSGLQRGKVGEVVHVGDLDLTILSVEGVNTRQYNQFNDANVAVSFTAVNARGKSNDTYGLNTYLAFLLVDGNGVGVSPGLGCAGCPEDIGSIELVPGGSISGKVYFKLDSTQWREVRYQAFLSSNSAIITP